MKASQPLRTSYSALQTFKQCPQKYKFQVIDKIRAPKSKEAIFGNKIHEALMFFHSQYPVSPTLDELLNYYKDIWNPEPFQNQEEDMIYFSEGIKMLKNYYQYFLKNRGNFTVLDIEAHFEIPIENPQTKEKCVLAGKIDRVDKLQDGTIEVIDYKTSKRLPSQIEANNDLQLSLYCLAIIYRWPSHNISPKLSFYYLKHNEILSTKRSKEQIEKAVNEVWKRLVEIKKSDFKPIPSALCGWCGYQKICPMWKHKFVKKVDDQEIQDVIKEFLEIKENNQKNNKRLNKLKKIINNYLDQEKIERVFGESGYVTRLFQIRNIYDLKKLNKDQLEKIKQEKKYTILKATPKRQKPSKDI